MESGRTQHKKKRASKKVIWIISAVVALMFMTMGGLVLKMLLSKDTARRRRQVQMVTLVKPPPPKIKEKIPPPEIKKEEVIETPPEETPPEDMNDVPKDDAPPIDDLLGLDADGSAGGDTFGLRAKRGGRSIIGGDTARRFAWYTAMVQKMLNEKVRQVLDDGGGIPKGNHKALVKILIDDSGRIQHYSILHASGNRRMDDAVKDALASFMLDELPPLDMPRVMKFRISSQG